MADIQNERCVLCLDEKRSPVSVQCGHSFCFECLKVYKSYQKYSWANKCPICRRYLKEKKRAVKRKFTSTNAYTENSITTTSANTSNTATLSTASSENQSEEVNFLGALTAANSREYTQEEVYILEEFMVLAAADSMEYTLDNSESIADSQDYDDDDGNIEEEDDDDDEDIYYDGYDTDEVDFYTDSDEETFNIFAEDEMHSNDLTSTAPYDFGEDISNVSGTENYNLTTNIAASEFNNDSTISSGDNDSTISTVDSNNNSSRFNSSNTSQESCPSDVAIMEDTIITD